MFELLDTDTASPARMPSSPMRNDPARLLDDLLVLVAFSGLVFGDSLRPRPIARFTLWLVAAAAGWWFVYRCVRRVESIWRSDRTRRARMLCWSILSLSVLFASVYAVAINSEPTVKVVSAMGWGLIVIAAAVQYVRRRRRESL